MTLFLFFPLDLFLQIWYPNFSSDEIWFISTDTLSRGRPFSVLSGSLA